MKWFKHETNAIKDEKIQLLMENFGIIGYGIYFALCELCAEKIDKKLSPRLEIGWPYIEYLTHCRRSTIRKVIDCCATHGLLLSESNDKMLICSIPNLLKRLDNWTTNSQVTCKQLASKEEEQEQEQEVKKKNKKKERPNLPILQDFFKDNKMAAEFLDYYQANGWKVGKNSMKDWQAAARNWKRRTGEFAKTTVGGWVKP